MQELVKIIYSGWEGEIGDIQGFANEICTECLQILQEPEKSMAKAAMKIICALVSTTGLCPIWE